LFSEWSGGRDGQPSSQEKSSPRLLLRWASAAIIRQTGAGKCGRVGAIEDESATNREIPFDAYVRGEFAEYVKLNKAADTRANDRVSSRAAGRHIEGA
jgi:hypothetical protein